MTNVLIILAISLGIIIFGYFWDRKFFIYKRVYNDMKNHLYEIGEFNWYDYKRHGVIKYTRIAQIISPQKSTKFNNLIFFKESNCVMVAEDVYIGGIFNVFSFFPAYYTAKFLKLKNKLEKEFDEEEENRRFLRELKEEEDRLHNEYGERENDLMDDEDIYNAYAEVVTINNYQRRKVRRKSFKFLK